MTSSSTKFDYVVSFGCSLARGEELIDRSKKYADQVANHFGAKLLDFSIPGTSVEMIAQNAINHIQANKDKLKESKTLILVEWTFCSRLNFCGKENRYYVLAAHNMEPKSRKMKLQNGHTHIYFNGDFDDMLDVKFYYDYHVNPTYVLYNMSRNIHHLQSFLKVKGYDYIFLFADDIEKNMITSLEAGFEKLNLGYVSHRDSYPDFKFIIDDIDKWHICPTSFLKHVRHCRFGTFGHPLEEGHLLYSKVLIDFIESKYGQQTLRGSESRVS